jgi:hypothetical protein
MTKHVFGIAAAAGLMAATFMMQTRAADGPGVDAKKAFETMKSLAGEWKVTSSEGPPSKIVYKVTSNGSTVMETYFPGTDHEMVSMYHLDGDDLRMTHYCAVGNQPRVKLDRKTSTPTELRFLFDGGSNLDPAKDMHMHEGRIFIRDAGRIETEWDGYQDGKKSGTHKFQLVRM